jgi:predicted acetyltransferase
MIRLLEEKDTPLAKSLWGYAFETDEPFYSWYFNNFFNPKNCLGFFEKNQLACCLQLNPYTLYLNGNSFQTSYIVGVITSPEYRNQGVMKKLLSKALIEIKERNHYISILMPFDTTFYSAYGWELCYHQLHYNIPLFTLRDLCGKDGTFYAIDIEKHIENLNIVYQTFLKDCHGYIQRTSKDWKVLLHDLLYNTNGHGYLLKNHQHEPVGYILYYFKNNKMVIHEMAYCNLWAQKSIFGFMHSHQSQATTVSWPAPLNDRTYLYLKDTIQPKPTNTIRIYPFMCGRVVDVKKALENCHFPKNLSFSFTMNIKDAYAPWNHQKFIVVLEKGTVSVEIIYRETVDFECSINTFSQLFFGALSVQEAIAWHKIIFSNSIKIEDLSKIFFKKNNYINEYF